jgi:hypothetical protein
MRDDDDISVLHAHEEEREGDNSRRHKFSFWSNTKLNLLLAIFRVWPLHTTATTKISS